MTNWFCFSDDAEKALKKVKNISDRRVLVSYADKKVNKKNKTEGISCLSSHNSAAHGVYLRPYSVK